MGKSDMPIRFFGLLLLFQTSLLFPPFQFFVVNPSISTLTEHLSNVLERISAHKAAIVMGLPLMEPELSINSVTTVSLKSKSFSFLNDKEVGLINGILDKVSKNINNNG